MPTKKLKSVLYIEDDEGLARLLQKRMGARDLEVKLALTGEAGLNDLAANSYDLVLLDYHLPGMDGLETFDAIHELYPDLPVVLLTASGNQRIAVSALERGVADYAVKDAEQTYFDLLPAIMQSAFTKERLIGENCRQHEELTIAKDKAEAANRAKSNFLATMSHEIRTPLNVVIGLTTILAKTPLNQEQLNIVHTLSNNADLLLKLIDDLLDISRIESGQVTLHISAFPLVSLINDMRVMFEEQARAKGIDLTFTDKTQAVHVEGDRRRIQQIIMNLMGNAIKFTESGTIHFTVDLLEKHGDITIVRFVISDTGIGIPADKLSMIFDKFTQADDTITRRYGGSGLGLSITKTLATMMHGSIDVKSDPQKGSTFTVTLPLKLADTQRETSEIMQIEPTAETGSGANAPILLVEDYAPNVMVATMMLEEIGYHVIAVSSGEEAINKILAATEPYMAILMDVQMHHMDGLEATRRIRDLEKTKGFKQPIIGVTAHALAGDREKCISAGMDDYMSKPIHPDILAATLNKITKKTAA